NPLFLRGIYFSSSMREGSALDAELAEAIGVPVEDVPEFKVWERERAYFLRDLFVEKVFRERGLVTRASNTRRMLRAQQVALFSFGFIALALFLGVAWFAKTHLPTDRSDLWQAVYAKGWEAGMVWKGSIVPVKGDGQFESAISTNTVKAGLKEMALPEFHLKLRELAEKPLKGSWLFGHVTKNYNRDRIEAQRIVLEDGVIAPLLEATR